MDKCLLRYSAASQPTLIPATTAPIDHSKALRETYYAVLVVDIHLENVRGRKVLSGEPSPDHRVGFLQGLLDADIATAAINIPL